MNSFKPNKKRALISATLEQVADELNDFVEPMQSTHPVLATTLKFALIHFGLVVKYKQEVLNQFTQSIMNHPEIFTQEILESEEFRDGLVVHLNTVLKLRGKKKLELAQDIFYDFSKSSQKPLYPLERYDDTLEKISENGIRLLGFISKEIPQITSDFVDKSTRQNGNQNDTDHDRDYYYDIYTHNKPLSFFIDLHIEHLATKYAKKHPEIFAKANEQKQNELRENFSLGISELEQLGLIKSFNDFTGTLGWTKTGPTNEYNLTNYGRMFISVIKPS